MLRSLSRASATVIAAAALLATITSEAAWAATVQVTNAGGNAGTENVLFNGSGDTTSGANYVIGHTSQTNKQVRFLSNEQLAVNNGTGGQSRIEDTAGNGFDSMIINYVDESWGITKLIIGISSTEPSGGWIDFFTGSKYSDTTFTPMPEGVTPTAHFNLGHGNTLFQIEAAAGEYLSSVDFRVGGTYVQGQKPAVTVYIDDVSQARIAGLERDDVIGPVVTPIPLPAAAWGGIVLFGLLGFNRFRRSSGKTLS
jgi:hypothetical protein